jgi:hypothetical protein
MKNLFIILFVTVAFTLIHPQQFSRLNGLEDEQGNTILLYSFGNDMTGLYAPVYKYFVNTATETKIIDAYAQQIDTFNVNAKSVQDYEFFPNDINNFINVGLTLNIDVLGYAARNDTITFTDWAFFFVDISKQHPQQVFISDFHKIYRSFDGGYTYPADSTIDFEFLSVADFDDKVFFGTDNNHLIKSEDQGINYSIVDTSDIQTSMPGLEFCYDVNQFHIYRLNRSNGKFTLNVSNNKGNAFSWTKTYESDTQFFITIDSTQSGVVYLAEGKQIYKSTNNGYNFYPYKSLPRNLVGLYKKTNSEILYAASKYQLYEVKPDTTIIIKSVPIPGYVFDWFPLAINNRWIYEVTILDENCSWSVDQYYERNIITKDTLINGQTYFKFEPALAFNYQFVRIDSTEGKLLAISPFDPNPAEIAIYDFLMELGDTVLFTPIEPFGGFTLVNQEALFIFGENRSVKELMALGFLPPPYSLVYGIGYYRDSFCEFGGHRRELIGCVINDVVYGDTTFTDVDDELNLLPTVYKLEQNYPNPFNPSTKISWQSPVGSWQTLKVYDVIGREVATLVDEYRNAGSYNLEFRIESLELSSGIYFYQLNARDYVETKKMMYLK